MNNTIYNYYILENLGNLPIIDVLYEFLPKTSPVILANKKAASSLFEAFLLKDNLPYRFIICTNNYSSKLAYSNLLLQGIDNKNIQILKIDKVENVYKIFTKSMNKKIKNFYQIKNEPITIDNDYIYDLCYEFYYSFVSDFKGLEKPKVEIIDELKGFKHFGDSVYNRISQTILNSINRFYQVKTISDEHFIKGFAGSAFFDLSDINPEIADLEVLLYKKLNIDYYFLKFLSFLKKSTLVKAMYYDDVSNTCFVVKKQLQNSDGCFQYKINNKRYTFLNNISVPQWLYDTPKDEIDISAFSKIKNADVKAEFIKKVGIEKLVHFGSIVDSYKNYPDNEWWQKSEYALIDMHKILPPIKRIEKNTFRKLRSKPIAYAPYLYMKNQTTGVIHLEGISPKCRNLYDAIKMRYQDLNLPVYEMMEVK